MLGLVKGFARSSPVIINNIDITGALPGTLSNNILTNTPANYFVSATPATLDDFKLSATSPARKKGLQSLGIYTDFFLTARSQGTNDVGAVEGP